MFKLIKKCEFNCHKWDQNKEKRLMFNKILSDIKQRVNAEVERHQIILCTVEIYRINIWQITKVVINTETEMNVISQYFTIKLNLQLLSDMKLSISKWINNQKTYYYDVYMMKICAINN